MINNKLITLIQPQLINNYKEYKYINRVSARAIIIKENKLLMIHTDTFNDYSFPGGGQEENESIIDTLKRELREETGAIDLITYQYYLGINEYSYYNSIAEKYINMISHYYLCEVGVSFIEPELEEYEIKAGYKSIWIDIDEALNHNINLLNNNDIHFRSFLYREVYVLKQLKNYLSNQDNPTSKLLQNYIDATNTHDFNNVKRLLSANPKYIFTNKICNTLNDIEDYFNNAWSIIINEYYHATDINIIVDKDDIKVLNYQYNYEGYSNNCFITGHGIATNIFIYDNNQWLLSYEHLSNLNHE